MLFVICFGGILFRSIGLLKGTATGGWVVQRRQNFYEIELLSWREHNKGKTYDWFKVKTKLMRSAKFRGLSVGAKLMWLQLLSECALESSEVCRVHPRVISKECHVKPQSVLRVLSELTELGWIRIVTAPPDRVDKRDKIEKSRESTAQNSPKHSQEILLPPEAAHPLIEIWNAHSGHLPKANSCSPARLKKIKARWPEQSSEQWVATVQKMAGSDFCNGKGSTSWRADFDFLLKPDTWAKVNEGKYDNSTSGPRTAQTAKYDQLDALEKKLEHKQ